MEIIIVHLVFLYFLKSIGWPSLYTITIVWIILGYLYVIISSVNSLAIIVIVHSIKEEHKKLVQKLEQETSNPSFGTFIERGMNSIRSLKHQFNKNL